jgi:hypothetical protein
MTNASTLCFDPSVGAALCELEVVEPAATAAATKVPVCTEVIISVIVTPASTWVVVTVTVVVVRPDWPLVAVMVYHPLGPVPPHPLPPHPAGPPHGPHPLAQADVLVEQLEYAEHKDDCKLETVAYDALGHAEETQLATPAVLVQCPDNALHVE